MSEYPFGETRRVRYQDGAGQIRTVRARLLPPKLIEESWMDLVLEISAADGDHRGAYLSLQSWQIYEISAD